MISIVMSTYNGSEYLIEQLDSIKNQTLPANEVIIADDCSTDNTLELVNEYVNNYSLNWIVYKNAEHYGWEKSYKESLSLAKGDYIFLADQDDIWKLDKLELMTKAMDELPDCKLLCGNYLKFYYDDKIDDVTKCTYRITKNSFNDKWVYNKRPGCVYCCRKELVKEMCDCWVDGYAHDLLLWQLAMAQDASYLLDYNVIYYRRHDHNATVPGKNDKITRLKHNEIIINNLQAFITYASNKELYKNNLDSIMRFLEFHNKRYELLKYRKLYNSFWLFRHLSCYDRGILSMGADILCALTK